MGNIKVAFFVYPSAFQNKGGGEVLLEKIEQYVGTKGAEVKRFNAWEDKVEDFDILHVFGSVKECLPLMAVAKSRNVKVVLESIFWSDFRRAFHEEGSFATKTEMFLRHAVKIALPFFPSARKKMFETADMIIPNSINEAKQISRLFNVPMEKMFVVHNGVDEVFSGAKGDMFIGEYGFKDFILSVGRIEPRKNQLNLIRAMKDIDKDLLLVGDTVSGYEWYREKCERAAGDNVHFLGGLPHESEMLMSAFAACDIFVLPAWFETPGLAALEAALAGAKVVATDGGSTKEYFKDEVLYLKPDSPSDIKDKIEIAIYKEKDKRLKEFVSDNYIWDKIAERTVEGYRRVLEGNK